MNDALVFICVTAMWFVLFWAAYLLVMVVCFSIADGNLTFARDLWRNLTNALRSSSAKKNYDDA